ncbi:RNA polymerase factor sigma-70 [Phycisphaerae bacterium RAS1]|nr:RNA polymerase factor sigma-70 [Phycisphaerae bacterium RAS1]
MRGTLTTHVSLLARLSDGDDATAWSDFLDRYGELIRSFAQRRGLQAADCDDVAQDVLLALTKAMRSFEYRAEKGRFRAYLKAATLRLVNRKFWQKTGVRPLEQVEDAGADPAVESLWEEEWRAHHVRQAMRTLEVEFGRTELRAFQWYGVEGRGAQETAAALSLSLNQVYQAKSRVMKRLAELIEEQTQDEG